MLNLFTRKPKIEFINETPGVAEMMPLIPARDYKHPWAIKALNDFSEIRKDPKWRHKNFIHTARCPGIFTIQRHGWIMRTWQDIVITTNKDDSINFSWLCARNQESISYHSPNQLADFWEEWPADTLRTIIKINTGWRCNVPKGYYLMEMPLPLSEENRFSVIPGFFPRDAGPASMNVQLMWHVLDGETLIKAGTPIAQYILVPKEQLDFTCRDAVPTDKLALSDLYDASRFVKNYNEVKKLFGG
jgi:hypothetical protein